MVLLGHKYDHVTSLLKAIFDGSVYNLNYLTMAWKASLLSHLPVSLALSLPSFPLLQPRADGWIHPDQPGMSSLPPAFNLDFTVEIPGQHFLRGLPYHGLLCETFSEHSGCSRNWNVAFRCRNQKYIGCCGAIIDDPEVISKFLKG